MRKYVTVKEIADRLGVCQSTIRNWSRKGALPRIVSMAGGKGLIEKSAYDKCLSEHWEKA